ncbi:hypothetical protein [Streptomyces sp. AC550_RSS872]|uniref:hypothetical protein n=1 Tax=Streptomyces sp. AC550_RSS872 TaxID=2823689 RepID=UPI001C278E92|nr:hypothetical protein [Streptomyces sp. AC550_RSS872]
MTDKPLPDEPFPEDERVRLLLMAAAEAEGGIVPPGAAFTARARRSLVRRRLAVVTATFAAGAAAAAGVLLASGVTGDDDPPPASEQCLNDTVRNIEDRQAQGYRPVYGTLHEDWIPVDDGVTKSSGFRFDIEGALADGRGVPSSGSVTVWHPVNEAQLPEPGRYVLLLDRADRPDRDGTPLFHLAPERALPLDTDDRVELRCADGSTGSVPRDRLRAATNGE